MRKKVVDPFPLIQTPGNVRQIIGKAYLTDPGQSEEKETREKGRGGEKKNFHGGASTPTICFPF